MGCGTSGVAGRKAPEGASTQRYWGPKDWVSWNLWNTLRRALEKRKVVRMRLDDGLLAHARSYPRPSFRVPVEPVTSDRFFRKRRRRQKEPRGLSLVGAPESRERSVTRKRKRIPSRLR